MPVALDIPLDGAARLRVSLLTDRIARIHLSPDGGFPDTGLNRYGFILDLAEPDLGFMHKDEGTTAAVETGALSITFDRVSRELTVSTVTGETLLRQTGFAFGDKGASARFAAAPDEDWVGFGDQTRERMYHRGHVADCHVCNVTSYIPVPFFMSTRGVGVLVNTTRRIAFDMAKSEPDAFSWSDGRGEVDYYVMVGADYRELLDLYTDLTGRPKLPPLWAFGLWYICRMQANDFEAVSDALNFRREQIPCDVLGLEPGWMGKNYDESTEKAWSPERFPIPSYCVNGPHNFFNAIQRMGFQMELWLCNDYDLSYEAERRARARIEKADEGGAAFHEDAEQDEHFVAPRRFDTITKPDEPWFEHLKKFVDQGVAFFKQDGAYQVLEHPDRVWGNGMLDDEMHDLYPLLYSRQMHEGFAEYTGRRPVVFTPAGWVGFQAWCGTWTGDTGGRLDTLGAMLNTSMVGHSWSTNDMEVAQPEGIHFGYLQPWSQINSWNYFRMPWVQGTALSEMHRFYSRLRARLIPYLYAWARHATRTGYPMLVPLPIEYPEDVECREVLHEYLLGRDLLVVVYKTRAYFPAGRWRDVWTGEVVEGGAWREIAWPEGRGGGLFLREGAIVPFGPLMQYRGEKPLDEIEVHCFPGAEESALEFYEDDGVTFEHESGAFAVTPLRCEDDGEAVHVNVGVTKGTFEGQATDRTWSFVIAAPDAPGAVTANGAPLSPDQWTHDPERGELRIEALSGPVEIEVGKS